MKLGVRILPRNEVLDSQGRTVEKTLIHHGHQLESCRVGKYVVLEVAEKNKDKAVAEAHRMAEEILYNPLIETYEIEVLSE